MTSLDRLLVIVNPASGRRRGRQVLEQVRPVFNAANAELDVQFCSGPGHAEQLANSLSLVDYQGCCIIGGDGTVHEVVNGLLSRNEPIRIPIGLIPAGSGNTLHMHLGGGAPVESARRILEGSTTALDVAEVTTGEQVTHCVNIVGWGAVASINCLAERMRWLGPVRYGVSTLGFIIRPRPRCARLLLDGQAVTDDFLLVVGCITKFTGNGMMLAPEAKIDDGLIDVLIVRPTARRNLLKLFYRVFTGTHLSLPCVEHRQVRGFALQQDNQSPLNLDGEGKGSAPFAVKMLPGALTIFS